MKKVVSETNGALFSLPWLVAKDHGLFEAEGIDMEFVDDESYQEEKERRIELMMPYQLNAENLAGGTPYILHDMPIHPGYEIDGEIVDHPRSLIYLQAENRLFAQQALMMHLLEPAPAS